MTAIIHPAQIEQVERLIHLARGEKVLLDADLAMLSSVLRSDRAVQVNVAIMRAFVSLRRMLAGNESLARKLADPLPQPSTLNPQPTSAPLNQERRFIPLRLDDAPIQGALAQFSCVNRMRAAIHCSRWN